MSHRRGSAETAALRHLPAPFHGGGSKSPLLAISSSDGLDTKSAYSLMIRYARPGLT